MLICRNFVGSENCVCYLYPEVEILCYLHVVGFMNNNLLKRQVLNLRYFNVLGLPKEDKLKSKFDEHLII